MRKKKVFIILLNWNNWNETRECLASLEKVNYPSFEVLIVDNNSTREEKKKISAFRSSHFATLVLLNKTNEGFAGGNNVGIKYALEHGADYILLLNNDTTVAPDFLAKLIEAGESNRDFGVLGSRIYQYGGNEIVFDGGRVNKWLTKGEHSWKPGFHSEIYEVDYITGAVFLIKREVIEKIGLMREEYFLYYEDVDWCMRARSRGYKCVLVPRSHIWHKVSATNKEGSASYIYYHTRNGLMLARFNGNIIQKIAVYLAGIWILFKQGIKFVFFPSKRLWARTMAEGVVDFYIRRYGKYTH